MENNQPVIPPQQPAVESFHPQQEQVQSARQPFYKNKKIIIIAIGIILLVIAISAGVLIFAQKPKPKTVTLTERGSGGIIHIKPNDTVIINVKEPSGMNIGTGISNPGVLSLIGKRFGPGTGTYNGKFIAIKPGETDIIVTAAPPCKTGSMCIPLQVLVYKEHIVVDK